MGRLLRKTHRLIYFACVLVVAGIHYPVLHFLAKRPERHYHRIAAIRERIARVSSRLIGLHFNVTYQTEIDWNTPYIICANHTSILDIAVLTHLIPHGFSFLGKEELLRQPVTSTFFKTIDIPINRDSKISSFRAFKRAEQLVQQGKTIAIFPEGGIEEQYPPTLQKFKAGAFRIAQTTQTPILPVVIHNAWSHMWDDGGFSGFRPGVIHVSVLQPIIIDPTSENQHNQLARLVYDKMEKCLRNPGSI